MRVILAPMQGVLDPFVRQLLTEVNEYDLCITEFVRVVDQLLPEKVFYRLCPELKNQGFTPSGTPVRVQLLGQHPNCLAENAHRSIELGSHGIDLNCGCPSKTVNGSNGGAALLKQPELIYQATLALRKTVPSHLPVSVKVRLGWDCTSQAFEIADAVQQGGATEITIHGRTKADGYRADRINWEKIGEVRSRLTIPVIANGEIWRWEDGKALYLNKIAKKCLGRIFKKSCKNMRKWKISMILVFIMLPASNNGYAILIKNILKQISFLSELKPAKLQKI